MRKIIGCTLLTMSLGTYSFAAISPPDPMPSGSQVACPHPTVGYTKTYNMTWVGLSGLQPYLDVLNSTPVEGQFTGDWSYVAGTNDVTGTLNVPTYYPFDDNEHWTPDCTHGAQINMNITGMAGLPSGQHFQWMQFFNETGNSGSRTNTIDPPKTALGEDDLPFYYNASEAGWESLSFSDRPRDWMPDATAHAGSVSFVTFLSSWDGTAPTSGSGTETVNVYGVVTWGYEYACVPEPTAAAVLLMGMIGLGCKRLPRRGD